MDTTLKTSKQKTSRRAFLCAAGIGASAVLGRRRASAQAPSSSLRIAFVGCNGLIAPTILSMLAPEYGAACPCYADVDSTQIEQAKTVFPRAVHYSDYREMFDKQAKNIDAVVINVPDHHHYHVTGIAMQLGKHVYTQKPLTHTLWEARQLTLAAAKYKVATQMGNQNHASEGNRLTVEYIRSGMLGEIRVAHAWTNRPLWPQGGVLRSEGNEMLRSFGASLGLTEDKVWPQALVRPSGEDPVPDTLNWDCWLGPAPVRPFKKLAYHPVLWRAWRDFGTGSLGDEGCHLLDGVFWAMDAKAPVAVEPVTQMLQPLDSETYPGTSVVKWEFAANDWRPGFVLYWHERGLRPSVPLELEPNLTLPESGGLIIGSKATLLITDDSGECHIIPQSKHKEMGKPPVTIQ